MEPRLKTEIWVKAQLRLCDLSCMACAVVKRGDSDAGGVLLKINRLGLGCVVLARVLDGDGNRVWMTAAGGEAEDAAASHEQEVVVDAYIHRQLDVDPDLWVLEVEDATGKFVPDGQMMTVK